MKSYWNGVIEAKPDFENLLKVLRREKPSRPTLFEFFLNDNLHALLAPELTVRASHVSCAYDILRVMAFRNAGYDYAVVQVPHLSFPTREREHRNGQTLSQNEGFVITDRKSFDAYQWPDPETADYAFLDKLGEAVPKGMKLGVAGPGGVLENVTFLLGYENMCFMISDDPELAGDVFEAVGTRLVTMYRKAVKSESVGFIIGNDDWGFKSQTMLAPEQMRRYVFPWHKQIVEAAHEAGKPAILHSCGNLRSVMDDVIDQIQYDGKHSFEDTIQPVEQAYEEYGKRIAILGGMDLDFICRSAPDEVHARARAMLERTESRGGYALGSGNSIPSYVPQEGYFALISAALGGRCA